MNNINFVLYREVKKLSSVILKFIGKGVKRVVGIFFLIIALFISVHATLVLHFCGENLRSVDFFSKENGSCSGKEKHSKPTHNGSVIKNIPCCSDNLLEIRTDDFSIIQSSFAFESSKAFNLNVLTFFPIFWKYDIFSKNTFKRIFPPLNNIAKSGIDLLIHICILII